MLVDLMTAHYNYATDEMLQAGQGVLPWELEMLPPQMDLPAAHFDYGSWLRPPSSFVETYSFLVDIHEYNLLTTLGVDFRPVREDRYPHLITVHMGGLSTKGCQGWICSQSMIFVRTGLKG